MWNGDLSLVDSLVHEDCVIHQARASGPPSEAHRGPNAIRELVEMGRAPFDPVEFAIEAGPIVEGDMLAGRWHCDGSYKGGMEGVAARPGTRVSFGGIDMMRIQDGRIIEYWVSSDGLALMAQLGAN